MFDGSLCIRAAGRPDIVCTAAEFVAANGEDMFDEVADAIEAGEVCRIGGGAFPEFEIFPIVQEAHQ